MMARAKQPTDTLQIAIRARERSIEKQRKKIALIRRLADEDVEAIEKNVAKNEILLDALKRGALKP